MHSHRRQQNTNTAPHADTQAERTQRHITAKCSFIAWARCKQATRLRPNRDQGFRGGVGSAPGPCQPPECSAQRPQHVGHGVCCPVSSSPASSALPAHAALHVHPFRQAKAGVQGLLLTMQKSMGLQIFLERLLKLRIPERYANRL